MAVMSPRERVRVCVGEESRPSIVDDDQRSSHAVVAVIRGVGGDLSGWKGENFAIR